jgi:hypothetical protein
MFLAGEHHQMTTLSTNRGINPERKNRFFAKTREAAGA